MWIVLGLGAIVTTIINVAMATARRDAKYVRFAGMALTALTVCAFYHEEAQRVVREDWSGLMDIMPVTSVILWICVVGSIALNSISMFRESR